MAEDGHIRLLAAEVGRLHNAVEKLVASNAELRLAIAEQGDDDDRTFKTAIEVGCKQEGCLARGMQQLRRYRPSPTFHLATSLARLPLWAPREVAHEHSRHSSCTLCYPAPTTPRAVLRHAVQENIVVIAKYRAQAERLEAELAELRAGRQPLGTAQALPTRELTAGGAAPAAEGAGGQQAGGQHQEQQGQAGHDAPTAGLASAGQEGGSGGRQAPDGGGGMWM